MKVFTITASSNVYSDVYIDQTMDEVEANRKYDGYTRGLDGDETSVCLHVFDCTTGLMETLKEKTIGDELEEEEEEEEEEEDES